MHENYKKASELFKANKIVAATALFEQVLADEPQHDEARFKLGVCRFRQKEYMRSENVFRLISSANHQNHEAWYYLGLSVERQGRSEEAIAAYKFAITVKPDFEPAINKLAKIKQEEKSKDATVFTSDSSEGPGEILYSTGHRRVSSYTRHMTIIIICLGAAITLIGLGFLNGHVRAGLAFANMAFGLAAVVAVDSFVRSRFVKYIVYERRIDIKKGILFRTHESFWLFEITNTSFSRSPINLLFGDSIISILTTTDLFMLTGMKAPKTASRMRTLKFAQVLFEELRNSVREQRGNVKKIWI